MEITEKENLLQQLKRRLAAAEDDLLSARLSASSIVIGKTVVVQRKKRFIVRSADLCSWCPGGLRLRGCLIKKSGEVSYLRNDLCEWKLEE